MIDRLSVHQLFISCVLILFSLSPAYAEFTPFALLDARAANVSGLDAAQQRSWLDGGLDPFRVDSNNDGLFLGQAILGGDWQFHEDFSLQGYVSAYDDGAETFGVNEFFIHYRPAPTGGYRISAKVGAFFPEISFENTKPGWTSGDVLSNSAINSWLGEELRLIGGELTLTRLGRAFRSDWDFGATLSAFGANDPTGTILAWRGWSLHDRQVRLGEKLPLAPLPSIGAEDIFVNQDQAVEPFLELDGRIGYATGFFAKQRRGLKINIYRYDNQADPKALEGGQYAWHTKFWHVGVSYPISPTTELLGQWLRGSTDMGSEENILVQIDMKAWYLAIKQQLGPVTLNLRYDDFIVQDRDSTPRDNNNQDGEAWTFSASYPVNDSMSVIMEYLVFDEVNYARQYFSLPIDVKQRQLQFALQWRF